MNLQNIRPAEGAGRKIYIETYGCQMNVVDSETIVSIMLAEGFVHTPDSGEADIILINTCSIRDNAEQRIWRRLEELGRQKKRRRNLMIGLVGCMAERLKERIVEERPEVDLIVGPDAYRDLPSLVRRVGDGARGINTELSKEETYAEISPVRLDRNGVGAFIAIMRGCNNMCSYCVVPYTRGRERSRDPQTILREARELFEAGYREVTLLGQNVNSYDWNGGNGRSGLMRGLSNGLQMTAQTEGLSAMGRNEGQKVGFPELLRRVARISPLLRVRFATSHPKDISDELLETIASMPNICSAIHLPAQSGSSRMLKAMNRKYTREWYLERIAAIRRIVPDCAISTDLIAGFCGETPEDHAETLSLMRTVGYDFAYMFKYSERPDTAAARNLRDDVPEEVKTARLTEIIALQNELSLASNRRDIGREFEILVEGESRRSGEQVSGRTPQNKVVVIGRREHRPGDYVRVRITGCSSATLQGEEIG